MTSTHSDTNKIHTQKKQKRNQKRINIRRESIRHKAKYNQQAMNNMQKEAKTQTITITNQKARKHIQKQIKRKSTRQETQSGTNTHKHT